VNLIIDGVKYSNLRQLVQIELKQRKAHCNCIRCREEGFFAHNLHSKISSIDFSKVKLLHYEYDASNGKEIFFSLEDPEQSFLIGYLRLRIPSSNAHRPEIKSSPTAIIREIRVVGELVKANENPGIRQIQHRGYGKILMEAGENWAKKVGCHKIVVISGIGARPYFYNLGYSIDGPYVSKSIDL
jgi:elongator complex protein 3